LAYATKAVDILSVTIESDNNDTKENTLSKEDKRIIILGVAYYNMGAELEYTKSYLCAIEAYERGINLLSEKYTKDNYVYNNLLKASKDLKEKLFKLNEYHNKCARNRLLNATKNLYANPFAQDNKLLLNYMKNETTRRRVKTPFSRTVKFDTTVNTFIEPNTHNEIFDRKIGIKNISHKLVI